MQRTAHSVCLVSLFSFLHLNVAQGLSKGGVFYFIKINSINFSKYYIFKFRIGGYPKKS